MNESDKEKAELSSAHSAVDLDKTFKLEGTDPAPMGYIFVCLACGKTSPTRYGFDGHNRNVAQHGWDESCMLNAQLFKVDQLVMKGVLVERVNGEPVEYEPMFKGGH